MKQYLVFFLCFTLSWSGAIACSSISDSKASRPDGAVILTVSAAASLQDALKDIQVVYQAEAPEATVVYNFGSSGSLAQQIAQGAPVDVFLSASVPWMDSLEAKGEILEESRRNLLQNAMVLIAPQDTAIASFEDLTTDTARKIAMGEPESVPAGGYAKELLSALGLFKALQPKLVFAKDVRQVLSYVETGNVDAGLVYATDAQVSESIQVLATAPPNSHAPIVYTIAVVEDSSEAAAAQQFLDFLSTETAADIFRNYGFSMAVEH
ncbi:MAG: molybdate ABC transporter substrate-binding protein [Elainellaceae cyanobacterium]